MSSRPRIVSLLPSATEIVCALGGTEELVGISHECDHPHEIRDRAVLTRPRIDSSGTSRAIDEAVRDVVRDALSVYLVDEAGLASLEPDVIVTQDLCEVCAVSLDDVRAAVARLAQAEGVKIVSLRPTVLGDLFEDVERVAVAIGRPAAGSALREEMQERIRVVAERARTADSRPRVASLEWIDPLMLGGTWMPEIIEAAGGTAVGTSPGALAPALTPEALGGLRPEVVVVKPCGFTLGRALQERDVLERSVLDVLDPETRVYVTDGNAFFNRPGPRIVESVEIMAACVHPSLFDDLDRKHASVIERLR